MVVTCGCKNLLNTITDVDNRYIERTAAEVVYYNVLVLFLVNAVCERRCGRLVYDTLNVKTRNLTCVLCSLTLRVGEVCGNGDNRVGYLLAEVALCVGLKLLENHRGNLLRSVLLAVDVNLVIAAHMALDGDDCLIGVLNRLVLCKLTYKALAVLCERNYGGSCSAALGVGDNHGLAALDNGYTAVGCT